MILQNVAKQAGGNLVDLVIIVRPVKYKPLTFVFPTAIIANCSGHYLECLITLRI